MSPDDLDPTTPSTERPERLPDPYSFCNCGKAGCPDISSDPQGNIVIADESVDLVAKGGRSGIRFSREQAVELRLWLEQHGY